MMILKSQDLQMIAVSKREGISKQGQPYLFYQGKFIDDEGNVCDLKIGKDVIADEGLITKLLVMKNVPITADIALYPSGFNLKGIVVKIDA